MKKGVILTFSLILVLAIAGLAYFKLSSSNNLIKKALLSSNKNSIDLVVKPQTVTDKVDIESVTLSKKGFVVVREMSDGKLGQVVEMSKPLEAGTTKNITVNLGNAKVNKNDLIAMVYEDYASDGVFNDLDMPALDKDGFMIARYVKTGELLPSNITEGESQSMMAMPGMKAMAKVKYTDNGFSPSSVTVNAGDMVEFINDSNKDMWVASVPHPQHSKLPSFDQFRPYKRGAIYRYVFDKKGTWEFHDHLNPGAGGKVTVD